MTKKVFIKMMTDYKKLQDDIDSVHDAMRKLDPDFGGFCISRVECFIMELIKHTFNDESDWVAYYIYDLSWGKKYKKGCVTEKDKDIPLKTLSDLYNLINKGE